MGTMTIDLQNASIFTREGTELCKVSGIREFKDTAGAEYTEPIIKPTECITMTYRITPANNRRFQKLFYGWRSTGPIRKRLIDKMLKRRLEALIR